MSWGFFMPKRQIMTCITAVCYPDTGTFDYWVTQSEDGSTFELLGAEIGSGHSIATELQRIVDRIIEPS